MAHIVKEEEVEERALVRRLDAQALIEKALEGSASVEIIERIVALAKDIQAERARCEWFEAMAKFQKECPAILKKKKVDAGSMKYRYAPIQEITTKVLPIMGQLGLSISWTQKTGKDFVEVNCRVSHERGHYQESGEIHMPVPPGLPDGRGANPMQRVGIALSYAKRYALLAALGIAPEDEDDTDGSTDSHEPTPMPRRASEPPRPPVAKPASGSTSARVITDKQHSRLWAIAYSAAKEAGLAELDAKDQLMAILKEHGFNSSSDVTEDKYEIIISELQQGN